MINTKWDICFQQKQYGICVEKSSKVNVDNYNINVLKEKYRNVLGSKEPIIVLQRCSLPFLNNTNCERQINSYIESNGDFNENKLTCLKKDNDCNNWKKLHTNTKLFQCNNMLKKNKNGNSLFKRKRSVLNIADLKRNLWQVKYDEDMKAEALRNSKNLRICLEKIIYDNKTSSIKNVPNKLKALQGIDLNGKTNRNSDIVSNNGNWGRGKSIINSNVTLQQNYDICKNIETCKKDNEDTDFEITSHNSTSSSKPIISIEDILKNDIANTEISIASSNQTMQRESTFSIKNTVTNRIKKNDTNTIVLPQSSFSENVTSDTKLITVKCPEIAKPVTKINVSVLNSNNSSKTEQKHTVLKEQKIINKGIETKRVNNTVQPLYVNTNLLKRNHVKSYQHTVNDSMKRVKLSRTIDFIVNVKHENNEKINTSNIVQNQTLSPSNSNIVQNKILSPPNSNIVQNKILSPPNSNIVQNKVLSPPNSNIVQNKVLSRPNSNIVQNQVLSPSNSNIVQNQVLSPPNSNIVQNQISSPNSNIVSEKNTYQIMPEIVNKTVVNSDIVTQDKSNKNVNTSITKIRNVPNLVEEKQTNSSNKSINKQNSDSLQNTWTSQKTVEKTCKSSVKDKCLISDKANCNNTVVGDEDEDSDCISLFADSTFMEEYDVSSLHSQEKPYVMTKTVFRNYYKSTTSEFQKAYEITDTNNCKNNTLRENKKPVALRLGLPVAKAKNSLSAKEKLFPRAPRKHETSKIGNLFSSTFKGYCYTLLRTGICSKSNCNFKHDFVTHMLVLYMDGEQHFFDVIDKLVSCKCVEFLRKFYQNLITCNSDHICVFKILKKLYELDIATNKLALDTMAVLKNNRVPLKLIVIKLTAIVSVNDSKFVNWILNIIGQCITQNGIISHNDEYWNTLKTLLLKVEHIDPQIVEIILRECITTQKNIQDINENLMNKLNDRTRSNIDLRLLLSFKNLLKYNRNENQVTRPKSISSKSVSSINSCNSNNVVNQADVALTINKTSRINNPKVSEKISNEMKRVDSNNNAQNKSNQFVLHKIDDLPKPHSVHARNRFWKFYADLHSLQEGLKHNDYDHVIQILNTAEKNNETFFSRTCYQILCNEVKTSASHLSKLIMRAARIGVKTIVYEILFNVTICILACLAEKELWVLAFRLLKDVIIILNIRNSFSDFDAVTVMLFAEIFLANQQPLRAFILLKQTNILYTDRTKWKARSDKKDESIRARIVTLLLDKLCEMFPDHAFFLFQFLINNQCSNFNPVDLTCPANKLVALFLVKKDYEMIVDIGKLIIDYNFVLSTATCRALITLLVHTNIDLAKQLYHNAIAMGIYSNVQFHPVISLIVNCDWTNEEMYLAISNLMQELLLNIGHAIGRVNSKQLITYLIFENIPSEKQLAYDEVTNQQYTEKIEESKKMMRSVLKTQFNPPILVQNKNNLFKITGVSIRRYLQSKYNR